LIGRDVRPESQVKRNEMVFTVLMTWTISCSNEFTFLPLFDDETAIPSTRKDGCTFAGNGSELVFDSRVDEIE
jgi:hypothetical protein